MKQVDFKVVREQLRGKTVALVGSAPTVLGNTIGKIDSHEIVVRVNNYKLDDFPNVGPLGVRCDVHYSFYGTSIKKTAAELKRDGVKLCMCKCPNSKPLQSLWHDVRGKTAGIDFTYIYRLRKDFWFCDTFIPDDARFLRNFDLLDCHIPTTGFSGLLDILDCEPRHIYMTGFDFFESGIHNVNEHWRAGDPTDPIGHRPLREKELLHTFVSSFPIELDASLTEAMQRLSQPAEIAA